MIVYFKGVKQKYVMIFDIEFDNKYGEEKLVQFAGLLFQRVGDDLYQICRSVNQYVQTEVSYLFSNYTGVTQDFLYKNGVRLQDIVQIVEDDFLKDVDKTDLLVVSHGVKGDCDILINNMINLKYDESTLKQISHWCTFQNAKRILGRKDTLKLNDIAEECGYYNGMEHNAYSDAWATVAVFSYLKGRE